jgi:hypothetical protein
MIYIHTHKVDWPCSPSFNLSIHFLPPTSTHSLKGPVLYFCPSLFKCIFIIQRGIAMLFPQWIYCALISSPLYYSSLSFPPTPIIQQLSVHFIMPFPTQIQCISMLFTVYHSLFYSLHPLFSLNSPTIKNVCVCVCIWLHLYLCMHLSFWSKGEFLISPTKFPFLSLLHHSWIAQVKDLVNTKFPPCLYYLCFHLVYTICSGVLPSLMPPLLHPQLRPSSLTWVTDCFLCFQSCAIIIHSPYNTVCTNAVS